MADTHTIHLVRTPQASPKSQPLDAASIAAEVLAVVRDCNQFLIEFQFHQERLADELGAKINELELSALHHVTRKAKRS